MAGHWTDRYSFIRGAVRLRDLIYLAMSDDEMVSAKTPSSFFVSFDANKWGNGGDTDWLTAGVGVAQQPLQQMIAVGEFGQAVLLGSGDRHEERIAKGPNSPTDRGPLRGVRTIGTRVYVVGMNRQAYRRDGANSWVAIDQGARPPRKSKAVVGFESVDGFSETDIYAVGWDGEIWSYDGEKWSQRDSPTNLVLTHVCCAGDGKVYACGRQGLLIRGRDDQWEIIEQKSVDDDFWSLAWFKGKLYLATTASLFTLQKKDTLAMVDMGEDQAETCYDLSTGDGLLLSTGAKDVMAFDGKVWTRID